MEFTRSILIISLLVLAFSFSGALAADQETQPFKGLEGVTLNGLYYLSYQAGQSHVFDANAGRWVTDDVNQFNIKRAYFTLKKKINRYISSRITLDAHQDDSGDLKVRIKYVYADIGFPKFAFITRPHLEFGLVHTPWLDFEEHINCYRMQDTMFMERVGIFNSGDFGLTVLGYFAGEMDKDYQKMVNAKYPGRYGSFAYGLYNGGGYHAAENNQNKTFQERVTVRPLPDIVPGLQLSELFIIGKGNGSGSLDDIEDWQTLAAMLSYEHRYVTVTGQVVNGKGNKSGSWSDKADYRGYSAFVEGKLTENWRVIGRYDNFDPDIDEDKDESSLIIAGIGYDFGHHNVLLLDYQVKTYEEEGHEDEPRLQITLQVDF